MFHMWFISFLLKTYVKSCFKTETSGAARLGWTIKTSRETQRFSISTNFVMSPLMAEGLAMREAIKKINAIGIFGV